MNFHLLFKYIRYQLFARHKHGHGIHSPFVYKLLTEVIEDERNFYTYFDLLELKEVLKENKETIDVSDFGAGSKVMNSRKRRISSISENSSIPPKYGELLFRLVNHFQPKNIIELGTSLGISTLYMAKASYKAQIYTVEGCKETAKVAKDNFRRLKAENIESHVAQFDDILPELLKKIKQLDFAFFDGNHRKEPTLKYFNLCLPYITNETVFVFDDIHWSKDMEEAWNEIIKHQKVTASIDLFFLGIVFFKQEMQQQNFVIKF